MIRFSTQIWALPSGSRLEGRQGSLRPATAGGNQVCFPGDQRIHPQEVEVREREARSPPYEAHGQSAPSFSLCDGSCVLDTDWPNTQLECPAGGGGRGRGSGRC